MLVTDDEVFVSARDFDRLPEYSTSIPTGVYVGKVWKARRGEGWMLGTFEDHDPPDPEFVMTRFRKLTIETPRAHQIRMTLTPWFPWSQEKVAR